MTGEPSLISILLVLTYAVLCVIWLMIARDVWSTVRRLRVPAGLEQTRRRLLAGGLAVSLALAVDFGYWMIDTAGRWGIVTGRPDRTLEEPILNMIEKLPLVVAGFAFLLTFTLVSRLTDADIDRRYFLRFADRILDAITFLDPDGRILEWNKSAERMFGWNRGQVVGHHILEFMVPKERKEEVEEVLNRVRSENKAFSLERTERLTASHSTINVSIDTAPVVDLDFIGYISIIRPAAQRNPFIDHPYFREHGLLARTPGKVFVAMPFSIHEGGFDVWAQLLVPLENDLRLKLVRADRQLAAHGVVDQVFHDIASSDLVVADLTGNNPNVYYEVGLAHALGIETLLLLRANENIPFNVRHLQIIYCDPTNLPQAREEIRRAIVSKRGLHEGPTSTATEHIYIVKDERILSGEPIIKGTRTSVRAVVELRRMGVAPEEVTRHLPHLTQAQVFDALSYYSDHQDEINRHIERNRVPDELIDPRVKDS